MEQLRVEVEGPVRTVVLCRPERRNALHRASADAREGVAARLERRAPRFEGR